jgi:putative ATPase
LALAQAALYVACAPKSNAAASAIWQAMADVKQQPTQRVPKHLKDSHYPAAKKAGFGVDYKYPHNFRDGFVPQEYLPAAIKKNYYTPKESGCEKDVKRYLQKLQTLIQNSKPLEDSTVEKD